MIWRIQEFLQNDLHFQITHMWRGGNRRVDMLTNFSLASWNLVVLESPSSELKQLIFDDIFGTCMSMNMV